MKRSRILSEMHKTARGLHSIGALDKQTLRELDTLALPPVQDLSRLKNGKSAKRSRAAPH